MSALSEGMIVLVAIAGIFLYFPTNSAKVAGTWFFQNTWLDKHIPLVPYFVIPYLAYYPYLVATPILVWGTPYAMHFFACLAIAGWSAALFWYFFPAGILRKRRLAPDMFSHMIIWIYENDHSNNTMPSSHVFHAIICSFYLSLTFPAFAPAFATVGFCIAISTVFVKQHHFADIIGGIAWAVVSIFLAHWVM